jgi:asparagine synthase (glutamine-hydrolysing)
VRGGFVGCFGEPAADQMARALAGFRWHSGAVEEHERGRLRLAVLVDPDHGPFVHVAGETTVIVHGDAQTSLRELERSGRRFAAVESDGRSLRAARDPLGLCPLFYRRIDGAIWLATEIPPLVALVRTAPDLDALARQAALVPDDRRSGYTGIFRVLPGFALDVGPDLSAKQRAYWLPERMFATYRGSRRAAEAGLRERFIAAVERTAVDGAGILLSGGIDSSAVAAIASPMSSALTAVHVRFSGFGDAAEERHARKVAEALGQSLEVVMPEIAPWDPAEDLRGSVVPYLVPPAFTAEPALAWLSAAGAGVALDGNDGDGVLGYRGREWGELLLGGSFGRLHELARSYGWQSVLRETIDDVVPPRLRLRRLRRRPIPPPTYLQRTERYFSDVLRPEMQKIDHEGWRPPFGEWRARQLRQVRPPTTIRNEDHELRGARFGIDLRHPFADRALVEFLISMPVALKSDPFRTKDLFRRALAADVPADALERPDKSEYASVFAELVGAERCVTWIRESDVRLPWVEYDALFRDAAEGDVPLALLMFLARAHVFAASCA